MKVNSLGDSSAKYGPCEVCGKPVSEVFAVKLLKHHIMEDGSVILPSDGMLFGHDECLQAFVNERVAGWPKDPDPMTEDEADEFCRSFDVFAE